MDSATEHLRALRFLAGPASLQTRCCDRTLLRSGSGAPMAFDGPYEAEELENVFRSSPGRKKERR